MCLSLPQTTSKFHRVEVSLHRYQLSCDTTKPQTHIIKHLTHEIDIPLYWGEEIIPFISCVTNTVEFRVKGLSEMKDT